MVQGPIKNIKIPERVTKYRKKSKKDKSIYFKNLKEIHKRVIESTKEKQILDLKRAAKIMLKRNKKRNKSK